MIDRRLLQHDFDETARRLARKRVDPALLAEARDHVEARRHLVTEEGELRAQLRRLSAEIGALMKAGRREEGEARKADVAEVKARLEAVEPALADREARLDELLLRIPNLPHDDAPDGNGEEDNRVVRVVGEERVPEGARPHWEIAEELGLLDAERGARVAGAMFALLRGDGARLLRALVQFGLTLHGEHYEEILPPSLVRSSVFVGTGHLPKFAEDGYSVPRDDLWLIPTGEVPLMGMHQGEVLDETDLPLRYCAHTPCFRREAGSAGKDTRGLQRLHEFHKVELVKICTAEQVDAEYTAMMADVERMLRALELPFRVVDLCAADMGNSSERVHDFEVWCPGVQRWLEVSSVGRFSDYQTRRGNIRYRPADGGKLRFAHAMNGSGLATPRIWAALLEHGWDPATRTVRLPAALVPFFGRERLAARGPRTLAR